MKYTNIIQILDESTLVRECRRSNNHNIVSYFNYTDNTVTVTIDSSSFTVNHLCLLGDDNVSLYVPTSDGFSEFDVILINSLVVN